MPVWTVNPSMLRLPSTAAKGTLAAFWVAATLVFAPGNAAAQSSDPFAISKELTLEAARGADREGPGLSLALVDGRELSRMVELRWEGDELAIDVDSAEMAGLPVPGGAAGFVKLSALEIASWEFDRLTQRLMVKRYRKSDGPNDIDVARRNFDGGERSPLLAGLVDYSIFGSIADGKPQIVAQVAPRISYGNFSMGGAVSIAPSAGNDRGAVVRLDTTAVFGIPSKGLVIRAGDLITAGADGQRALRIGGFQVGTDFNLRPDLVINPLPEFAGSVAVPTSVDLLINDQRLLRSEIEAGDFRVHNIPLATGRGEVAVVFNDEFGREIVQSTRLYVSRDMLAKGLWEGAANVGWIRRRYGEVSNDYRDMVGTFFVRRGLSRSLSVGFSGEAGRGVWNVGAEAQATIANLAMAFGEVRYSNTSTKAGMLFRGGIESNGSGVSGRLEAIIPTVDYSDVASQTDDEPVARQYIASIDFDLGRASRLQISVARKDRVGESDQLYRDQRIDFARATLRHELRKGVSLSADVSYRRSDRTALIARAGVAIRFGGRKSVHASVRHDGDRTWGDVSLFRPDIESGDFGYAANASLSESPRFAATAAYRANFARFQGEAEYAGGDIAIRGSAQGTVIFVDNQFFARNQSSSSYALVRTGTVEDVAITHENRFAGKTGKNGRLLVANVPSLVPMQFDIDPDLLPPDAIARQTYKRVVVSRGAVALVDMDIEAYRSQLVQVSDQSGEALPIGTRLIAQPSGREYTVAFDGIFDFNALSVDDYLVIEGEMGQACRIELPENMDPDSFEIPELVSICTHSTIARADDVSDQSTAVPSL